MKVLFSLGHLVATPGALQALEENHQSGLRYLARHLSGDWGELDADDKTANNTALRDGSRILSAYQLQDQQKIWIITEGDRSSTCILLPSEY
jgi:hypothetical protein